MSDTPVRLTKKGANMAVQKSDTSPDDGIVTPQQRCLQYDVLHCVSHILPQENVMVWLQGYINWHTSITTHQIARSNVHDTMANLSYEYGGHHEHRFPVESHFADGPKLRFSTLELFVPRPLSI